MKASLSRKRKMALRRRVGVREDSPDDEEKRTFTFHCQNSNPGPPIPQPIRYIDWAIAAANITGHFNEIGAKP